MRQHLAGAATILLAIGIGTSACAAPGDAVSPSEPGLSRSTGTSKVAAEPGGAMLRCLLPPKIRTAGGRTAGLAPSRIAELSRYQCYARGGKAVPSAL